MRDKVPHMGEGLNGRENYFLYKTVISSALQRSIISSSTSFEIGGSSILILG